MKFKRPKHILSRKSAVETLSPMMLEALDLTRELESLPMPERIPFVLSSLSDEFLRAAGDRADFSEEGGSNDESSAVALLAIGMIGRAVSDEELASGTLTRL